MKQEKNLLKIIDLFAGIGGFRIASKNAFKKSGLRQECVFTSEIDQKAKITYLNNFGGKEEDIINVREIGESAEKVPDHDFLFAGFPCQCFSNAGKKMGFLDQTRGTLFFDICKIIKFKKPKFILLENVKYLTRHDGGKTWKIITESLNQLGYSIPTKPLILSPTDFNLPQERFRVFIPGILKSEDISFEDFNLENEKLEYTLNREIIIEKFLLKNPESELFLDKKSYLVNCLDAWREFIKNVKFPQGCSLPVIWLWELRSDKPIKAKSDWERNYIQKMRLLYQENQKFIDKWFKKYNPELWNKREQKLEWQAGKDEKEIRNSLIVLRQSGIRCKKFNKFPTLVAIVEKMFIYDSNIRKWRHISPEECAAMQNFPKSFKLYKDIYEDKDYHFTFKQFGNSVNVKVVEKIINKMLEKYYGKRN